MTEITIYKNIYQWLANDSIPDDLFCGLFTTIKIYDGRLFANKDDEIKVIKRIYKLKFTFENITNVVSTYIDLNKDEIAVENNCMFYDMYLSTEVVSTGFYSLFNNSRITYENLCGFYLNLSQNNITKITCYSDAAEEMKKLPNKKMQKLSEYCFEFDFSNMDKSRFIPLTNARLDEFERKYAEEEQSTIINQKNTELIAKLNKLSPEKLTIITNLLEFMSK